MDFRKDASRLWRTIKSLDGKPFNPPNGPVSFSGVQHARADRLADLFNKQYTRVRPHDRDPLMRRTVRKVKRTPFEDAPQFTTVDVAAVIRRAKNSKAAGPDGITMLHLKHLGPLGLERLTDVINVSLACCSIPAIWKRSTVIPLPKAGKDPSQSTSYRPVSLLCPAAKVLEALLLPSVMEHMPPATHHHSFRPLHSRCSRRLSSTRTSATYRTPTRGKDHQLRGRHRYPLPTCQIQVAAQKINAYLPTLKARLDDKQLIISTEKSQSRC